MKTSAPPSNLHNKGLMSRHLDKVYIMSRRDSCNSLFDKQFQKTCFFSEAINYENLVHCKCNTFQIYYPRNTAHSKCSALKMQYIPNALLFKCPPNAIPSKCSTLKMLYPRNATPFKCSSLEMQYPPNVVTSKYNTLKI